MRRLYSRGNWRKQALAQAGAVCSPFSGSVSVMGMLRQPRLARWHNDSTWLTLMGLWKELLPSWRTQNGTENKADLRTLKGSPSKPRIWSRGIDRLAQRSTSFAPDPCCKRTNWTKVYETSQQYLLNMLNGSEILRVEKYMRWSKYRGHFRSFT